MDEKKSLCERYSAFMEKHGKKILVAEGLVIAGAFAVAPKVRREIASYRQLQADAADAKMILVEMSYTVDALVSAAVDNKLLAPDEAFQHSAA